MKVEGAIKIEGGCNCGRIAYEATVDPNAAGICHCDDCQAFSGAPFRASVPVRAEDFHLLRGEPAVYVKVADSGTRRAQGFCGVCGSALYATQPDRPVVYNLRLGSVKQRARIVPKRQIWCGSAQAWALDIRDIPAFPGQPS